MGAIDSHNFRWQSGRGTKALKKVCVARNAKDRVFINAVNSVLANIFLAKKYFEWSGMDKTSSAEVQEAVAMSLIKNQWCAEDDNTEDQEANNRPDNNPRDCAKHPQDYGRVADPDRSWVALGLFLIPGYRSWVSPASPWRADKKNVCTPFSILFF